MFRKYLISIILFGIILPGFCETISGNVRQDEILNKKNVVVDSKSQKPIKGAKVYVPSYGYYTVTDSEGKFELNAGIDNRAIMQIEKSGYRPFSITIDKMINDKPLRIGLEKSSALDAFIDGGVYHLGDNMYSENSAQCRQFKVKPMGPFYSKILKLKRPGDDKQVVLVFGSVIGLDTKLAKELGQNAIVSVYSSPVEIIFNGQKIGELNINGDNQRIIIPNAIIKDTNDLTIKTGKNLFQHNYIDYDDMEFANLRIEIIDKMYAKK